MKQLFIGAEGTLGIITAAVLRLFPKPTASETAWIARRVAREPASSCWATCARSMGDAVSAFELICRAAHRFPAGGRAGPRGPDARGPSLVRADGRDEPGPGRLAARAACARRSPRAHEAGLIRDALIAASGAQAAKLWKMRESLAEAQVSRRRRDRARRIGARVAHPRVHRAGRCGAGAQPTPASGCAPSATWATATCTTTRSGPLDWDLRALRAEKRDRINRIVHDIVVELGGSISAEHGIGRSRLAELEHYKAPVEIGMMRAVKRALDPHNIMNPHKVVPASGFQRSAPSFVIPGLVPGIHHPACSNTR